ncbi:MAG: hypothetical protein DMF24_07175 [Verrucomicrobia bacterium]|nr:MAG: hypothetical protein DMF24_07175 [Verrucomicrobiota bacterium]
MTEQKRILGSARVSRARDGVSPSRTFPGVRHRTGSFAFSERLFRRDTETSTRDACAPQTI